MLTLARLLERHVEGRSTTCCVLECRVDKKAERRRNKLCFTSRKKEEIRVARSIFACRGTVQCVQHNSAVHHAFSCCNIESNPSSRTSRLKGVQTRVLNLSSIRLGPKISCDSSLKIPRPAEDNKKVFSSSILRSLLLWSTEYSVSCRSEIVSSLRCPFKICRVTHGGN